MPRTGSRNSPKVTRELAFANLLKEGPHGEEHHICHVRITDGRIEFLEDSTHALAGLMVDVPDYINSNS